MLSERFLSVLTCPESGQPLRLATAEELARAKCEHGLTRQDGGIVYPIQEDIPMLMAEYGVRIVPGAE